MRRRNPTTGRFLQAPDWRNDFWSFVRKGTGCWLWTGPVSSNGYGDFNQIGCPYGRLAHRIAWELLQGPIPPSMTIDHVRERCRSRLCVNPAHMEVVTAEENTRRRPDLTRVQKRGANICVNGHLVEGENCYVYRGHTHCRACRLAANRNRRGGVAPRTLNTHCPRGHEFTPENTLVKRRGRECRACHNTLARERRSRR